MAFQNHNLPRNVSVPGFGSINYSHQRKPFLWSWFLHPPIVYWKTGLFLSCVLSSFSFFFVYLCLLSISNCPTPQISFFFFISLACKLYETLRPRFFRVGNKSIPFVNISCCYHSLKSRIEHEIQARPIDFLAKDLEIWLLTGVRDKVHSETVVSTKGF